jgi:hypothetical protein
MQLLLDEVTKAVAADASIGCVWLYLKEYYLSHRVFIIHAC